ncbi:MAG: hypothetical protein ACTHLB_04140 [Parafilimonas sp.]
MKHELFKGKTFKQAVSIQVVATSPAMQIKNFLQDKPALFYSTFGVRLVEKRSKVWRKMYAGKTISPHFMPELNIEIRDIFKN